MRDVIVPVHQIRPSMRGYDFESIELAIQCPLPEGYKRFMSLFGPGVIGLQPTDREGYVEIAGQETLLEQIRLLEQQQNSSASHPLNLLVIAEDISQNERFALRPSTGDIISLDEGSDIHAANDPLGNFDAFLDYINPYNRYPVRRTIISHGMTRVLDSSVVESYIHPFYPEGVTLNFDRHYSAIEVTPNSSMLDLLADIANQDANVTLTMHDEIDSRPLAALQIAQHASWITLDNPSAKLELITNQQHHELFLKWVMERLHERQLRTSV